MKICAKRLYSFRVQCDLFELAGLFFLDRNGFFYRLAFEVIYVVCFEAQYVTDAKCREYTKINKHMIAVLSLLFVI